MIFDGRYGARSRADFSGADLLRPSFNVRRHAFPWRRKPPKKTCFYYLRFLAEKLARNDQSLNFAGAFADGAELHVAVELFRGIVLDEAVATVNLYAFVCDAHGNFPGKKFC